MTTYALVAIAAAVLALWLAAKLAAWRRTGIAIRRATRAGAGETAAVALLERAGYRILEAQARVDWAPLVDGEPFHVELRADFLVEAAGELLVAEVKTGAEAVSLGTAATRRQLLEYSVAFGADGVLLVCAERGTIERVAFPKTCLVVGTARNVG